MTATQDLTARAMAALAEKETCQATNLSYFTNAIIKCVLPRGHALGKVRHKGYEVNGKLRDWDL